VIINEKTLNIPNPKDDINKIRDAAQQFEQLFLHQMLKQSRQAQTQSDDEEESMFKKSHGEKIFQDMLDFEHAGNMAKSGGIGLTEILVQQMTGKGGIGGRESMLPMNIMGSREVKVNTAFSQPLYGNISSHFGERIHPISGEHKHHNGVDIVAGYGANISAAAPGKVTFSGPMGNYGNTVIIEHNNGYSTLYAHTSELLVEVGQGVRRGDIIAKVGSSGRSTGPHLHFELINGGKRVDPMKYFKGVSPRE